MAINTAEINHKESTVRVKIRLDASTGSQNDFHKYTEAYENLDLLITHSLLKFLLVFLRSWSLQNVDCLFGLCRVLNSSSIHASPRTFNGVHISFLLNSSLY